MLEVTTDKTPKGLIGLCKTHMGLEGETLQQFAAGYKQLTDKDKDDFRKEFESYGYVVKDAAPAA